MTPEFLIKARVRDHFDKGMGRDRTLWRWLELRHPCGLDSAALKHWHIEFDCRTPAAHRN